MTRLPELEYLILSALEPGAAVLVADIVKQTGKDQSLVTAGATMLAQRGLVTIAEESQEEFSLTDGGLAAAKGFPERKALVALKASGGAAAFTELPKLLGKDDVRAEVKWLTRKGWCTRDVGILAVADKGEAALNVKGADEEFVEKLAALGSATESDLAKAGVDIAAALELLKGRNELLKRRKRVNRKLSLTAEGEQLKSGGIEPAQEITQLTPELLASGKWHDVVFRKYDPQLATAPLYPGKEHPLQRVIQEIRRTFFEMGFEEVESPAVDTAFWVFDALFQPQDHPAREMQDTFYMAEPKHGRLPDEKLVQTVARTHENGGDTGSTGWQYRWDPALAPRPVLRTHCTAATIRALARHAGEKGVAPGKYFTVGPVFRRETTDYKHLPVFHQVDGIIVDPHASLATLVGTLTAFYEKMGFPKVRVVPSFFPYTEPSAEVNLWLESRRDWVEMGGSGIFRPEVTRPQGIRDRVLAWGLGIVRLAMMLYETGSLQDLFYATMPWLREEPLCRS